MPWTVVTAHVFPFLNDWFLLHWPKKKDICKKKIFKHAEQSLLKSENILCTLPSASISGFWIRSTKQTSWLRCWGGRMVQARERHQKGCLAHLTKLRKQKKKYEDKCAIEFKTLFFINFIHFKILRMQDLRFTFQKFSFWSKKKYLKSHHILMTISRFFLFYQYSTWPDFQFWPSQVI